MLEGEPAATANSIVCSRARESFYVFQRLMQPTVSNHPYVDSVHLRAICWELQQMIDGKYDRLAIAIPPRHFKSYLTSVALPAYMLGLDPTHEIICASYGLELAEIFGNHTRRMMRSSPYQEVYPDTRLASKNPAAGHLVTTKGGYRHATSIGGTVTGLGAELIIFDDPLKANDAGSEASRDAAFEWLQNAPSRITKSRGRIIVPMQRLHADDPIGRLKQQGTWKVLELPAQFSLKTEVHTGLDKSVIFNPGEVLFPERFSATDLQKRKIEIGEIAYNAQYLQNPVPAGGGIFKLEQFKRFDLKENNQRSKYEAIIASIDPGVSSAPNGDPTAITIWGVRGLELYLIFAQTGNWALTEQIKHVEHWREICNVVLVERSHIGVALVEFLVKEKPYPRNFVGYSPRQEKSVRAEAAALAVEKGRVFLPEKADWLEAYEKELVAFPHGAHDDLVDSTSQLFRQLELGFSGIISLKCYKGNAPVVYASCCGSY